MLRNLRISKVLRRRGTGESGLGIQSAKGKVHWFFLHNQSGRTWRIFAEWGSDRI